MKKTIYVLIFCVISIGAACAEEARRSDPNQWFYSANSDYEKGDYGKALLQYLSAIDSGMASGNLFYNIGNAYFKTGQVGRAILYYKKAIRLMPYDSDLKSNLELARSLAPETAPEPGPVERLIRVVLYPFKDIALGRLALIATIIYIVISLITAFLILRQDLRGRFMVLYFLFLIVCLYVIFVFSARYYDEVMVVHGIVVEKDTDAKYEPIDKSTTYFKLGLGADVVIVKTKNDWTQIRRLDGKMGWVKKDAVGEI